MSKQLQERHVCEYASNYYNVPACIGRLIRYGRRSGIIAEDRGHYIGVNFDHDKPMVVVNIHPKDDKLEYLGLGKVRKLTRSQKRYRDYKHEEYPDSFADYLGIRTKS